MSYDYKALPVGTAVFYTGDMANHSAEGEIIEQVPATKYSPAGYKIRMEDGSIKNLIMSASFGSPAVSDGHRFEVLEERKEFYNKRRQQLSERLKDSKE